MVAGLHEQESDDIGVTKSVYDKIRTLQKRCTECGAINRLEVHHRIFRSAKQGGLDKFLETQLATYKKAYGKPMKGRKMHSIQNLVVLCTKCHTRVHNPGVGTNLRTKYRHSFTCPHTGFNVFYYREEAPLY